MRHCKRRLIEQGEQSQSGAEEGRQGAFDALNAMSDFCHSAACRHRTLVGYFGQELDHDNCGACDACLNEIETVDDSLVIGQKVLSCVLRLEERYGSDYTAKVLIGSNDQRIIERGHENLSTHGLLEEHSLRTVRDWTEQLVGQGFLEKTGEYNTLSVTQLGRELLRGGHTPRLLKPSEPQRSRRSRTQEDGDQWEGVHKGLFEELRKLRRDLAHERSVPAYIVFGDQSLRDMARSRPTTLDDFRQVSGVGEKKLTEYGDAFVTCIRQFFDSH